MRYFALFLMLFSLCVFSVGCNDTTDPAPTTSPVIEEEDDADVTVEGDATIDVDGDVEVEGDEEPGL